MIEFLHHLLRCIASSGQQFIGQQYINIPSIPNQLVGTSSITVNQGITVVSLVLLHLNSFIEDRLATLKNVIKEPALDKWNLYLGKSWLMVLTKPND